MLHPDRGPTPPAYFHGKQHRCVATNCPGTDVNGSATPPRSQHGCRPHRGSSVCRVGRSCRHDLPAIRRHDPHASAAVSARSTARNVSVPRGRRRIRGDVALRGVPTGDHRRGRSGLVDRPVPSTNGSWVPTLRLQYDGHARPLSRMRVGLRRGTAGCPPHTNGFISFTHSLRAGTGLFSSPSYSMTSGPLKLADLSRPMNFGRSRLPVPMMTSLGWRCGL